MIYLLVILFLENATYGKNLAMEEYKQFLIEGTIHYHSDSLRQSYFFSNQIKISSVFFNATGIAFNTKHTIQQSCNNIIFQYQDHPTMSQECFECKSRCLSPEFLKNAEYGCKFGSRQTCIDSKTQKCIIEVLIEQKTIRGVSHIFNHCSDLQIGRIDSLVDIPGYSPYHAEIIIYFIILSIASCVCGVFYNSCMCCALYYRGWIREDSFDIVKRFTDKTPWKYQCNSKIIPVSTSTTTRIKPIKIPFIYCYEATRISDDCHSQKLLGRQIKNSYENTQCILSKKKIQNVYFHCPFCAMNSNLHKLLSLGSVIGGKYDMELPCCNTWINQNEMINHCYLWIPSEKVLVES
jgi:hypothetical protein